MSLSLSRRTLIKLMCKIISGLTCHNPDNHCSANDLTSRPAFSAAWADLTNSKAEFEEAAVDQESSAEISARPDLPVHPESLCTFLELQSHVRRYQIKIVCSDLMLKRERERVSDERSRSVGAFTLFQKREHEKGLLQAASARLRAQLV